MYILIKDDIPLGHQVNCAAHASLSCFLKYSTDEAMQKWLHHSFRKVTCSVTPEQFEKSKRFKNHVIVAEDAIGDQEVAIAFCPRLHWPRAFSRFNLFGKEEEISLDKN